MTAETLYEQIAEHKTDLNLIDGDEDGENDDTSNEKPGDGSVLRQSGHQRGEQSEQSEVPELGGAGDKRDSEGGSRNAGGSSRSDGREPRGSGGTSQKDGEASQKPSEEVQVEPEEKAPTTNSEWARQRRENRELKAELAKLKAAQSTPIAPPPAVDAKPADRVDVKETTKEPNKEENYQAWLEWKLAQNDSTIQEQTKLNKELNDWRETEVKSRREQAAIQADVEAFTTIEQRYIEKNPDYTNATNSARETYFNSLKMAQPNATDKQINWAIDNEILGLARKWAAEGLDPAEEFYSMAQERFGYVPKAEEEESPVEQERSPLRRAAEKPNLKVVTNNKRRSASPLSGGGQGGRLPLTQEAAGDMSVGEFSRLTAAELADLEAQG